MKTRIELETESHSKTCAGQVTLSWATRDSRTYNCTGCGSFKYYGETGTIETVNAVRSNVVPSVSDLMLQSYPERREYSKFGYDFGEPIDLLAQVRIPAAPYSLVDVHVLPSIGPIPLSPIQASLDAVIDALRNGTETDAVIAMIRGI